MALTPHGYLESHSKLVVANTSSAYRRKPRAVSNVRPACRAVCCSHSGCDPSPEGGASLCNISIPRALSMCGWTKAQQVLLNATHPISHFQSCTMTRRVSARKWPALQTNGQLMGKPQKATTQNQFSHLEGRVMMKGVSSLASALCNDMTYYPHCLAKSFFLVFLANAGAPCLPILPGWSFRCWEHMRTGCCEVVVPRC